MPDRYEPEKKKRIEDATARLEAEAEETGIDAAPLKRFAEIFFAHAAGEDITVYPAESLAGIAKAAFAFIAQRDANVPKVSLRDIDAADERGRPVTAIDIVGKNRPFIFDSVLGEIQAAGQPIHLVLHPIFEVSRDEAGRLTEFAAAGAESKGRPNRESFLHIEIARLPDEAAKSELEASLKSLLQEVRVATEDWRAMRDRLRMAIRDYRIDPPELDEDELEEAIALLEWLEDDNFTFLGTREFTYEQDSGGALDHAHGEGLGLLRDPEVKVLRRGAELVTMTPEIQEFLMSPEPLIIMKANVRSRVHRRDHMDYIGVKIFDDHNRVTGELRVVGLFTSSAFTRSVQSIPYIRRKVDQILKRAGFDPFSHSGRTLLNILESFPRTELFQADLSTLYDQAMAVLHLQERPRVRALSRADKFGRFVSVLVYVPRDHYSSDIRAKIGQALAEMYDGRISAAYPAFPEGHLARVHFIVAREARDPKTAPVDPDQGEVEARIRAITRTFEDGLREALANAFPQQTELFGEYRDAFGREYQAAFSPQDAVEDIRIGRELSDRSVIAAHFHRRIAGGLRRTALRFHHLDAPIPLSRRVPLLENLGFAVVNERTYLVRPATGSAVYIHDMTLAAKDEAGSGEVDPVGDAASRLQEAISAVWGGRADNDGFNALVLSAGITWREAALLRTIGRYLRQTQLPYSLDYIWHTLGRNALLARLLVDRFRARFDPAIEDREAAEADAEKALDGPLDRVDSLDEDTILRAYRAVILATKRTDYFQRDAEGAPPLAITIKLKPRDLAFLTPPRPFREIFVHSPQVEGVHMRFGPVARGGLRWSDRPQDFRVEVLGLVKAQQVKNAVIVPVGAKGGFFPRLLPAEGSREEIFEAGRDAYVAFVDRLLALTDDLEGDEVIPPNDVVRHDEDDPYLVVAADKGTATFSDTANAVSETHGFWLGDAFASGGSAGYDHKEMGITARGAWEAVKRHFREVDHDIQSEPFTVAGVGDMSGDVFGNGMLLSRAIRLVAAFDHRDIFIDPDPDLEASFKERQRLFDLPRSSWKDYDTSLVSKGGGVFSRHDKTVPLSPEICTLLGLSGTSARPNEVIRAILKAQVDLLWFGGIGTYVRAPHESDAEVGDKANDQIRITSAEVGARVVGEGANLGMTPQARVDYGLRGGRCNSDAIDNSGGVNSSDLEVNIKIALAPSLRSGKLELEERNRCLAAMTDQVADLVLRNNIQQTLAISLEQMRGLDALANQARFMNELEAAGRLDRAVEVLPDNSTLSERQAQRQPLTRAEIGVLLSYAKIVLFDDLVASDIPDDEYLARELFRYFPENMQERFGDEISGHRLRREIIATQLANSLINRGGPTAIVRLRDRTGATPADITRAYTAVRDAFSMQRLHAELEALDNKIGGQLQLELYLRVQDVLLDRIGWFLRNVDLRSGIGAVVDRFQETLEALRQLLPDLLPEFAANAVKSRKAWLVEAQVPDELAEELAILPELANAIDVALIAERCGRPIEAAAAAYFEVADRFCFSRLEAMILAVESPDYYENLATEKARDQLASAHRALALDVLSYADGGFPDVSAWEEEYGRNVSATASRVAAILADGRATTAKATVAASLLAELAEQQADLGSRLPHSKVNAGSGEAP
ncbi:NAD-glutamate dehydrogenase [Afifella aestuarii]|uniref:NAD-glutamate dehydrogenase n=1 Tax=Afifella aestuarii TaxID=1909496 RepID=UPI000FE2C42A|nr:NAD-glutamate dehydrogenase [Afifella aestuarii]